MRTAETQQRASGRAGATAGFFGGLIGIACCVSPVVLYLVGVATATEAVSLGNALYGEYAWYFRAAGLATGGVALALWLARRGQCDVRGARANWRTLALAAGTGVATYAGLYWFTTWLGTIAPTT